MASSEGVLVLSDSEIQIKSEEMKSSIREEYGSVPQTDNLETQQVSRKTSALVFSYILYWGHAKNSSQRKKFWQRKLFAKKRCKESKEKYC